MLFNSIESLLEDIVKNNANNFLGFLKNPVLHTDSYKLGHKHMEPADTKYIYSNLTPRFNKYFKLKFPDHDGKVVNFGLQVFLIKEIINAWNEHFFKQPLEEVMKNIETIFYPYIGMDRERLKHFEDLHKLGYLPLHIKALPEGTVVPLNIPLLTITNTHDSFSFLSNYIESVLSLYLHKPITVATIAREFSKLTNHWWDKTVVDHTFKKFAIHDFSLRGHDSLDAAETCGAAALLYSNGTDNVPGLVLARTLYAADENTAFSVSATEHSVTTLGINFYKDIKLEGKIKELSEELLTLMYTLGIQDEFEQANGELVTLYYLLTKRFPIGLLSYVADSYDYWRVLTLILPLLKDIILNREGKLVIRPDSGDPVDMVVGKSRHSLILNTESELNDCIVDAYDGKSFIYKGKAYAITGYEEYVNEYGDQNLGRTVGYTNINALINDCNILTEITDIDTESVTWKGSIEVLGEIFGTTTNSKGYKELHPQIGLIYGDGITYERASNIFKGLADKGYAASNVVLGVGSYTFASSTRDDLGIAVKATHAVVGDKNIPIYKEPKTDDGSKKSSKGYLKVDYDKKGEIKLFSDVSLQEETTGLLQSVFVNSQLYSLTTFDQIKSRLD